MATYTVDTERSRLFALARSGVHDTEIVWGGITGTIETDAENLASTILSVEVDMCRADAGDWLKNKKLKSELEYVKYPKAQFLFEEISKIDIRDSTIHLNVQGCISWRGKTVPILVSCEGLMSDSQLEAVGVFTINMKDFGITPPKILMFKVDEVVHCTMKILAS